MWLVSSTAHDAWVAFERVIAANKFRVHSPKVGDGCSILFTENSLLETMSSIGLILKI